MTTKGYSAIILILIAFAMIGQSGAHAQMLEVGLPTRVIVSPAPQAPSYQPQDLVMDPPEYRMAWVYSFGSEFASPTATTTLINTLADNNFNVVVPEIRKYGDAYYNSSYEPWASDIVAGYDPLRDMLDKAHARNMEVYGWIVTFRIWPRNRIAPATHIWSKHPEWAMLNTNGSNAVGNYYNLDPGIPAVQQYVCDVVTDAVTKYPDLDGFNFDYIRYESTIWGYNPISKWRFLYDSGLTAWEASTAYGLNAEVVPTTLNGHRYICTTAGGSGATEPVWLSGATVTDGTTIWTENGSDVPTSTYDANWDQWSEWKRQQITSVVKKCYLEAIAINPKIKMTVDTIGWMRGDPNEDFTETRAYGDVCQDHEGWMEDHIIDVNILMNYKRDWCTAAEPFWGAYYGGDQQSDHRIWSHWLGSMQTSTGRHVIDGIAGYLNVMPGIRKQWEHSRDNGVGLGVYRYGFTVGLEDAFNPGKPVLNGTTVVQGSDPMFYSTIKSTMFPNPAPVPDMPWKSNPTTGYLFGQVTNVLEPDDPVYKNWLYKATVTATGPVGDPDPQTYEEETDATGTYGFIDRRPGIYSISVSQDGFVPVTGEMAEVTAGIATRTDFRIRPLVTPGDYKTIPEALDPNTVTDAQLIGISGKVATAATGELPGCMYVEQADRSCGIQITFGSLTPIVAEGDRVSFIGYADTINGERMLTHATMISSTSGPALEPLQSSVKDLDRGPSSTALLVQCTGKVIDNGPGWFSLDDGSGVAKVLCSGLLGPAKNTMVSAVGLSGYNNGRIIRARRQADIMNLSATTVNAPSGTVGTGFNLLSLPYIPPNPSPAALFNPVDLTNALFAWDNDTQSFKAYKSTDPTAFGKMSPNEGYALVATAPIALSYPGVPPGATDVRISIPKTGWSLIGQPFTNATLWTDVMVTDGTQTLTLQGAINAGWIGRIAFTWDTASGIWGYVGTGARGSRFDDSLRPWHAYWITTYRDNLAIIIPAAE